MHLYHMHPTARSIDGREIPLMLVIRETLKFIGHKSLEKLKEQVYNQNSYKKEINILCL